MPRQYVGGLTVYIPRPKTTHRRGVSIQVQTRVVDAIVVTVPGRTWAHFSLGSVYPQRRPDRTYLIVPIRNDGTALLEGQGNLWVWKRGKRSPIVSAILTLDTTVPQTWVSYPISWTTHPGSGTYSFREVIRWGKYKTMRSGSFSLR
jgi:hypothetical protein